MKSRLLIIILFFNIAVFITLGSPVIAGIVTDQLGRKITLPDYPQRVVSLAPSITEIIYALGQQHRLT
jgi:iron complex transport system substrate-binding protein